MKRRFGRVRNSLCCQSVHYMEVTGSALLQACLLLGGNNRQTLNKRMFGLRFHTGLISLEFHSACWCVLLGRTTKFANSPRVLAMAALDKILRMV
jgi:hypothetical protein